MPKIQYYQIFQTRANIFFRKIEEIFFINLHKLKKMLKMYRKLFFLNVVLILSGCVFV